MGNETPATASTSIETTDALERAHHLLEETDRNVFISGKAGTGKSTFLANFRKTTTNNIAIVAPTGVAALNVQGQTIHSFFSIKPGLVDFRSFRPARNKKLFGNIDLLVIDEISMVRADLFDAVEATLRKNNDKSLPFGGVQVCVIGDLFQLPPVIRQEEKPFYNQTYSSPFFFASGNYHAADFELVKFDKVFRQADNSFIHALNKVRVGHKGPDLLNYLNQRHQADLHDDPPPITLAATNAIADKINNEALKALPGTGYLFKGALEGRFAVGKDRLPSPEKLTLKKGAQVMFTRNDIVKKRWVNGTIGTVSYVDEENIEVTVKQKNGRRRSFSLSPEKWVSYEYEFNEKKNKLEQKEVGSFTQFPLMLAWAVTIHKSQGKTLENVVVDLGRGAFAPGQVYVALSRCRSFESLSLKNPLTPRDIWCDRSILDFARSYYG